MLEVNNISKAFRRKNALQETSFSLQPGITGLLGPNGAGKTTLLRILSTYYRPDSGTVTLDGLDWGRQIEEARNIIGYLPQHIGLFPQLTVYEYLQYIGVLRGMANQEIQRGITLVLKEVNLEDRARDKVKSLSGGMKQRLGIAQAILHNPRLLLVDEPTAGLDPEERIRFRNLMKRLSENRIVLFSTHITEDVAMTCEQMLLINNGAVEKYDNTQELIGMAEGKVWNLSTDRVEFEQLKGQEGIFISNVQQSGDHIELRILSNEKPNENAKLVKPTLEEGYMIWLKGN